MANRNTYLYVYSDSAKNSQAQGHIICRAFSKDQTQYCIHDLLIGSLIGFMT